MGIDDVNLIFQKKIAKPVFFFSIHYLSYNLNDKADCLICSATSRSLDFTYVNSGQNNFFVGSKFQGPFERPNGGKEQILTG